MSDYYRPPTKDRVRSYWDTHLGKYPYKRNLKYLKHQRPEMKVVGLMDLLMIHHRNSAIHTFEVAYITSLLEPG